MAMFADATTFLSSKCKDFCSIQSDSQDNLSQWFCQYRLSVNRDKIKAVAIAPGLSGEFLILDKKALFGSKDVFMCSR